MLSPEEIRQWTWAKRREEESLFKEEIEKLKEENNDLKKKLEKIREVIKGE